MLYRWRADRCGSVGERMRWLGALRSDTPGAAWAGDRTHRTDSFLQHIRRGALVYATVLADRELMCENYPEDQ